jgi:hypothetical protein
MTKLAILTACLVSGSAMAAEHVRYDCRAGYFEQDVPSTPVHGCSIWYASDDWDGVAAKDKAVGAAMHACARESGDSPCYLFGCRVDFSDLDAPSTDCPR